MGNTLKLIEVRSVDNTEFRLFDEIPMLIQDISKYVFYADESDSTLYAYEDGSLVSKITTTTPFVDFFCYYQDLENQNFVGNPIPDFYVGVVDKVGD